MVRVSTIDTRLATKPWPCPWCGETVDAGEAIYPLKAGSTESSACHDCAWRAENGYPLFREAP